LSLKIIWIDQNYVPENISIIQNTKSPLFFPPTLRREGLRGISICFYYAKNKTKKFIEKLMRLKESKNSKIIVEELEVYA
jgi:hypothetical protein